MVGEALDRVLREPEDPFAEGEDVGEFLTERGGLADSGLPADRHIHEVVEAVLVVAEIRNVCHD